MFVILEQRMIFLAKSNGNGWRMRSIVLMKVKYGLQLLGVEYKFYQQRRLFKRNGILKVRRG